MGELNRAGYAASQGEHVMLLNDDVVVKTRGWDTIVLECFQRFPDPIAPDPRQRHADSRLSVYVPDPRRANSANSSAESARPNTSATASTTTSRTSSTSWPSSANAGAIYLA